MCFGISSSKSLFKEIESMNSNALGRTLALIKCVIGEMKYICKKKSLKAHYAITWWRTKLSRKWPDQNNYDNNKKSPNSLLSLSLGELLFEAIVLTYVLDMHFFCFQASLFAFNESWWEKKLLKKVMFSTEVKKCYY